MGERGRSRAAWVCGFSAMKAFRKMRNEPGRSLGSAPRPVNRASRQASYRISAAACGKFNALAWGTCANQRSRHSGTAGHAGGGASGRAPPGVAILAVMFLGVAFWNGFPLIFYDTGAYVLEGLGHVFLVERAPVYAELLFLAGGAFSLWPIVILQALMTGYLILETARAEVPGLTLRGLAVIGAGADAADRHRLVCRPGRARLLHAAGDPGLLAAAVPRRSGWRKVRWRWVAGITGAGGRPAIPRIWA